MPKIDVSREGLMRQIADAKVSCARHALASPFFFHEGCNLVDARKALAEAKARIKVAQAAWDALIAPANGWAPDPLKESDHDPHPSEAVGKDREIYDAIARNYAQGAQPLNQAGAAQDAARLDWLERLIGETSIVRLLPCGELRWIQVLPAFDSLPENHEPQPSLRAAIDAAMQASTRDSQKDGMPVALHLLTPQQLLPIWQERNGPGIPVGWANIYEFFVECVQRFVPSSPEPQPAHQGAHWCDNQPFSAPPASTADPLELPPLPEPAIWDPGRWGVGWNETQVTAYAREAVRAALGRGDRLREALNCAEAALSQCMRCADPECKQTQDDYISTAIETIRRARAALTSQPPLPPTGD